MVFNSGDCQLRYNEVLEVLWAAVTRGFPLGSEKKGKKNVLLPIKRNVSYVHYFDIGRIIFWYKKARVSVRIFNVNNRFIHHRVVIAFMKAPLGNE